MAGSSREADGTETLRTRITYRMYSSTLFSPGWLARLGLAALTVLLTSCATPMPRTDDPLQNYNRKMYAFNDLADRVAIRPVAVGYRKVTNETTRRLVSNFFANVESPITIANDLLQANVKEAGKATSRFVINSTIGVLGLFDPASEMNIQASATDFGVTLAKWGVPEGPYIVIPLYGSSTVRDLGRIPGRRFLLRSAALVFATATICASTPNMRRRCCI